MLQLRFLRIVAAFFIELFFLHIPFSVGQDVSVDAADPAAAKSKAKASSITSYKIQVDVNEVHVDAVVLDFFGRPVTDLTADNFEIHQDNQKVEVTSAVYIDYGKPVKYSSSERQNTPYLPKVPPDVLKEEEVARTILFVVDGGNPQYVRMSINRFLEGQMRPNDLVGILHTGQGNSVFNVFSSDKRQLAARINSANIFSNPTNFNVNDGEYVENIYGGLQEANLKRTYNSQLAILEYSIRALSDMPGRKIILFLTDTPTLRRPKPDDTEMIMDLERFYKPRFERLASDAMKAGVVVHMMNMKGLTMSGNDTLDPPNPIAARTGGLYVEDNNFFMDGIGKDVDKMISGYYLISYLPPPNMFDFDLKGNEVYHKVRVKVKGRYGSVYTRDGFYGSYEKRQDSAAAEAPPLQKVIFSPFVHAEINVNIAAGYVKNNERRVVTNALSTTGAPQYHPIDKDQYDNNVPTNLSSSIEIVKEVNVVDYLVRSWIHVDPKDVKIVETEDGGARIALKVMCVTADQSGGIQDARLEEYRYNIAPKNKAENLAFIQKHGIRFSMLLLVRYPGVYTVRIGIQDMETGKLGSAWQLVEIPDLKDKSIALSNVFMIVSEDDLAWMNANVSEQIAKGGLFFPTINKEGIRTPALRTYKAGDQLRTLTMLYNVDAKAAARNEIEVRTVLYKDGTEYLRGEPKLITAEEARNPKGIQILRKLTMGGDMPPGDYVLQVLVVDKKIRAKEDKPKGVLSKIGKAYIGDTFMDYNEKVKGLASEILTFRVTEDD